MYKLILCFVVILSGCEEAVYVHDEHPEHHEHHHADAPLPSVSPAAAARVLLLESQNINRPTEAMGLVDAHEEAGHHEQALAELRVRAAALGADAVIGIEFHHGESHDEPLHLSGMAVRFRDLLRNQPYDVVGDLDIVADMHHQDDAIAELQQRARALEADLIIKIAYRHGEGHEPVHLTGTAIRYRTSSGL